MKRRLDICIQIQNKFRDYSSFVKAITQIIPNLISLLGSKNINDVIETIKLLVALNKSNIQASEVFKLNYLIYYFIDWHYKNVSFNLDKRKNN